MLQELEYPWVACLSILSTGIPLLLLAAHAVRASRREEATATLLTSTVSRFFAADGTSKAVEYTGDEQARGSRPHESEGLDAQLGNLAIAAKGAAALDVDSTGP